MAPRFTVAVLLYGDHPELARRCLNSIHPTEWVGEVRIGLNRVSLRTRKFALAWAERWPTSRVTFYEAVWARPDVPAFKYPVMRHMLRRLLSPLVCWFDDDSYL